MRPRLPFLDGLRGFAAVFVVLHHVHAEVMRTVVLSPGLEMATRFLALGHYPVAVFIVVSGFSLMLPVTAGLGIEGGFIAYLGRRARRILPAYYAALSASLLLIMAFPAVWPERVGLGAVLSHAGLFHNVRRDWCYAIDPPTWSIATEAQIYLLFPLLLLPLFRRCGGAATVAAATALGLAIQWAARSSIGWVCPWYLGLFAMGMWAATDTAGLERRDKAYGLNARSARASAVAFVAALSVACRGPQWVVAADLLTGASAAWFLTWASARRDARPALVRLLETRAAIFLGGISYELYLVHYPVITLASDLIRTKWTGSPWIFSVLLCASSVTLSVLLAMALREGTNRGFAPSEFLFRRNAPKRFAAKKELSLSNL